MIASRILTALLASLVAVLLLAGVPTGDLRHPRDNGLLLKPPGKSLWVVVADSSQAGSEWESDQDGSDPTAVSRFNERFGREHASSRHMKGRERADDLHAQPRAHPATGPPLA